MEPNPPCPQLAGLSRAKSLCFTGHRPEKLPQNEMLQGLRQTLQHYILRAVLKGYTSFYTGLADGVDYLAADILFGLRLVKPQIIVIGVQPCADYEEFYYRRGYDMQHLYAMLNQIDRHIILPGSARDPGIFLRRNDFMVEHSAAIIAVCDNGRSGSMYTLNYAKRRGLAYCRIYPRPPENTIPPVQQWPVEMGVART